MLSFDCFMIHVLFLNRFTQYFHNFNYFDSLNFLLVINFLITFPINHSTNLSFISYQLIDFLKSHSFLLLLYKFSIQFSLQFNFHFYFIELHYLSANHFYLNLCIHLPNYWKFHFIIHQITSNLYFIFKPVNTPIHLFFLPLDLRLLLY